MKKRIISTLIVIAFIATSIIFMTTAAKAEEGNSFVKFLKKVIVYPFSLTKKSTEAATKTVTKGAEMVVKTGEATAGVATGNLEKTKDLIVEPVKGSVETGYTAVESSVKAPVEAAQEADQVVEGTESK